MNFQGRRLTVLAMSILMAAGCSKESLAPTDRHEAEEPGFTVEVNAGPIDTRTCFGEKEGDTYPTLWTTAKSARFSLNGDAFVDAYPTVGDGGKEASFSVTFSSTSATSGTLYGFSPKGNYSGATSTSNKGGFTSSAPSSKYSSVYLVMPAAQTPLESSPDESAQVIWGKTAYSGGLPRSVSMHFTHVAAYGRMSIRNYEGAPIQSVSITFPTAVAGNSISFFYGNGTYYGTPYSEGEYANANVSTITLDAKYVRDNVFWFGLMPVGELRTGSLVITVTDGNSKTYTKTVQLSSSKKIAFNRGRVTTFNVDMEGAGATDSSTDADNARLAYGSCYEVPAVSVPASSLPYSKSGNRVSGSEGDYWLNAATNTSGQLYVVHRTKESTGYVRNLIMLHDASRKAALWVAYSMNATTWKDANVGRNDNWVYDPAIAESSQPCLTSSYSGNYDRGHQAASNDRQYSKAANMQTFYFSNMTPQYASLNQGNWATLENKVQPFGWSCRNTDTLYVVTGPIFESGSSTATDALGKSCPIPSRYYKCVMKCSFNSSGAMTAASGAAYLTPGNDASSNTSYTGWITSIDAVEELTGFDFFTNVPQSLQDAAERTKVALF